MNRLMWVLPWVLISSSAYHNDHREVVCKKASECKYLVDAMNHEYLMFYTKKETK